MSIFTIENSIMLSRPVFGITAGQQAQQNTLIPSELAASTINSGKLPSTDNFNITKRLYHKASALEPYPT